MMVESGAASWRKGHLSRDPKAEEERGQGEGKVSGPQDQPEAGREGARAAHPPAAQPLYPAAGHLRGRTLIPFGLKREEKKLHPAWCLVPVIKLPAPLRPDESPVPICNYI